MSTSLFAALLGEQHIPKSTVRGRVHTTEPEEVKPAKAPRKRRKRPETADRRATLPRGVQKYRGTTERNILVLAVFMDGEKHTLYDVALAIGAPSIEYLRDFIATAVRVGFLKRDGFQPREEAPSGFGKFHHYYRLAR